MKKTRAGRKADARVLPYGRQCVDADDVAAVAAVLRSDWLTCGPKVEEFEKAFAAKVGAKYAVAVNSGTAALHASMFAAGIGPGDGVIVPPMTFAATANCVVFQGGTPVFADVDPDTLLIDPRKVEQKITLARRGGKRMKAIIAVDYAGLPCDYDALKSLAKKHGLVFVADACHALGAAYKGKAVGSLADLNCFSFHPVKHITTGEGGMITTDNPDFAQRMRDFRTHGITRDAARFTQVSGLPPSQGFGVASRFQVSHYYEMQSLGYNYRMPDINAALGLSQLKKLDRFVARRQEIAAKYDEAFRSLRPRLVPVSECRGVTVSGSNPDTPILPYPHTHAYHLYVVQIDFPRIGKTRNEVFQSLEKAGIKAQVHYIPVHLHPFYRERFGYGPGLCPVAERAYERLLSLPMYPALRDEDVEWVVESVTQVVGGTCAKKAP